MKRDLLLLVFSLIPAVYFLMTFISPLKDVFSMDPYDPSTPKWFFLFLAFHFFMFTWGVFAVAITLVNLLGSDKPKNVKAVWAISFIVIPMFSVPAFWILKLLEDRNESSAGSKRQGS